MLSPLLTTVVLSSRLSNKNFHNSIGGLAMQVPFFVLVRSGLGLRILVLIFAA